MSRTHIRAGRALRVLLGVAIAVCLGMPAARADVVVLSSDSRNYRAGQELSDGDAITLSEQERISVLLPSNAVREIKGPHDGKVADLASGRPSSGRELWTLVKGYLTTGGVDESQVAATRALSPTSSTPAAPDEDASWRALPLGASGAFCVVEGEAVRIVRDGAARQSVRLANQGMLKIATVDFAEGAASAPWPESLPMVSETRYRFIYPGRSPTEFTLKVVGKTDIEGPEVLAALHAAGCSQQIAAWLKTKAAH